MSGNYSDAIVRLVCTYKAHECSWCSERICHGEKCHYRESYESGVWVHAWVHQYCEEDRLSSPVRELQDGWTAREFLHDVSVLCA